MAYLSSVVFFCARYTRPNDPRLMGFSILKSWISMEPKWAGMHPPPGGVPSNPNSLLILLRGRNDWRSSNCSEGVLEIVGNTICWSLYSYAVCRHSQANALRNVTLKMAKGMNLRSKLMTHFTTLSACSAALAIQMGISPVAESRLSCLLFSN